MSREEREERDYANMSKRRRLRYVNVNYCTWWRLSSQYENSFHLSYIFSFCSRDGVDGGKTPKRIENAIKSDSK